MFEEKRDNRHEAAMGINNPLAGGSNPAKFHRLYPNRILHRQIDRSCTIEMQHDKLTVEGHRECLFFF